MPCMRAYQKIKILVKVCPTLFLLVTSVVHVDTVLINGRWPAKKTGYFEYWAAYFSRKYRMVGQALDCHDAYF